jgi:hypothetical protein
MSTAAVVAVAAGVALAVTSRTTSDLEDAQTQHSVLDFIQRERNAHVNRGMDEELLVICAARAGTPCAAGGATPADNQLVAYRIGRLDPFPPAADRELSRMGFNSTSFTFTPGPALFVDSFARSVAPPDTPRNLELGIRLRGSLQTILFRQDGVALPSFAAPSAIVVAPKLHDLGSRVTPDPTPRLRPARASGARRVFLE